MGVRDLGYRPYDGPRHAARHNTAVLFRHGLRRAWASWLVKIAAFLGWLPALVAVVASFGYFYLREQISSPSGERLPGLDGADVLRTVYAWQLWLFVALISLGAGAGAIAEDLKLRAFQFYFAKPVTAEQYLLGRMGAVAAWCFALTLAPSLVIIVGLVGTVAVEERLAAAGLVFPSLLVSGVTAVAIGTVSVAVSSIGKSRALAMGTWLVVFVVPHILAAIVDKAAEWPWLRLLSLPALLGILADALWKLEPSDATVRWTHAGPVLVVMVLASVAAARRRLEHAEVIT